MNLWTALPTSEVLIDNQPRTIEATNKISDLIVYLDFAEPIIGSADTLLGQLNASSGSLSAIHRKSYANRRFGYVVNSPALRIFRCLHVGKAFRVIMHLNTSHIFKLGEFKFPKVLLERK